MRVRTRLPRTAFAIGAAAALGVTILAASPASASPPRLECTIVGTNGNDVLRGTAGVDVICGLGGADKLYGLAGNDTLRGGAGDDELYGGPGDDVISGGAGNDEVEGEPEGPVPYYYDFTMGVHFLNTAAKPLVLKDGGGIECTNTVAPQPLTVPTGAFTTALFFVKEENCDQRTPSAHYLVSLPGDATTIGHLWWVAGDAYHRASFHVVCTGQLKCQWKQGATEGVLNISY